MTAEYVRRLGQPRDLAPGFTASFPLRCGPVYHTLFLNCGGKGWRRDRIQNLTLLLDASVVQQYENAATLVEWLKFRGLISTKKRLAPSSLFLPCGPLWTRGAHHLELTFDVDLAWAAPRVQVSAHTQEDVA